MGSIIVINKSSSSISAFVSKCTNSNGDESWFNCGIEGNGWTPPQMTVNDVVTKDLSDAVNEPNSPFQNCAPFLQYFEQFGGEYGSESGPVFTFLAQLLTLFKSHPSSWPPSPCKRVPATLTRLVVLVSRVLCRSLRLVR